VASRLEADIFRDYELYLTSFTLRPFDDGRFIVKVNGETLYDKERTGKFPKYADDIKDKLSAYA
jgi:predicted Rdx family selenoprotein